MDTKVKLFLVITSVLQCRCISLRRQLEHIAETQRESQGVLEDVVLTRRLFNGYDPRELTNILGAPSMPSHLPEAEPILPGHTLIKPALGMLKSAVKFPHRDLEDGSGVYGNYDTIGIRYDAKNERVLYSGFRRMPTNVITEPEIELQRSNQITLYPNKDQLSRKRKNGRIYLKRIYVTKLPTELKKFRSKRKEKCRQRRPNLLRSDIDNGIKNAELTNNLVVDNDTKKQIGYWNTQNTFNHISIDQSAPDFFDLIPPKNNEDGRQWWFFNEVDFNRPLQTI